MEKIEHPYIQKSAFSGVLDKNLKKMEKRLGVKLSVRGTSLVIDGPEEKIEHAKFYFDKLQAGVVTLQDEPTCYGIDLALPPILIEICSHYVRDSFDAGQQL